jgi:drug/metabolite transporter (DMT)-like permease
MADRMIGETEKESEKKFERRAIAREVRKEVETRIVTVITTALALVAALFWQTAITDTIKTLIPVSGAWGYEILVALGVTVCAALAIYLLTKTAPKE